MTKLLSITAAVLVIGAVAPAWAGTSSNGLSPNGLTANGLTTNGIALNGATLEDVVAVLIEVQLPR